MHYRCANPAKVHKDTKFLYLRKMMPQISENSSRIARNTILLYFRMLLLMVIGLFTSSVVLNALGIEDYGIYGAVGGVVMLFTVVTNSVSNSISRFLSWHLGHDGGGAMLHKVFSTAVIMQLLLCVVLLLITETAGLWWLNNKMNIPAERMGAAGWVLQCSMGVLMINLVSVPFNACIISHERMDVFAWVSIGEAVLKLGVALLLLFSGLDKLKLYAVLMLGVALLVRLAYGIICRRLFPETRGKVVFDGKLLGQMAGFSGWSVLGSSTQVVNTQGVTQLVNFFFGVAVNAARSVAMQVENIFKQFINNFLTAINPQITKTWAIQDKKYCFQLVGKGVKYIGLIFLVLGIPVFLETPELLRLWLRKYPDGTVIFTRLTLLCILADTLFNPLMVLIQAEGRIKHYYLVTSAVSLICFSGSWVAYACGQPAFVSYLFYALVYLLIDVARLYYARRYTGIPLRALAGEALLPVAFVAFGGSALPLLVHFVMAPGIWRMLVVVIAEVITLPLVCWRVALTPGEKAFLHSKAGRLLPGFLFPVPEDEG